MRDKKKKNRTEEGEKKGTVIGIEDVQEVHLHLERTDQDHHQELPRSKHRLYLQYLCVNLISC